LLNSVEVIAIYLVHFVCCLFFLLCLCIKLLSLQTSALSFTSFLIHYLFVPCWDPRDISVSGHYILSRGVKFQITVTKLLKYTPRLLFDSLVGRDSRWLARIYSPSLVALEEVVVSCLLEILQFSCCGLTHNAVKKGIPGF